MEMAVRTVDCNVICRYIHYYWTFSHFVQKRMVHLPPAIILLNLVTFGLIFGIPEIILATPPTVIAMVFIGMFYVQEVLGKEVTIPGSD